MAFAENPADFLDTEEFAVWASVAGYEPFAVIFDRPYEDVLDVAGESVTALAASADLAAAAVVRGTSLAIGGRTYQVVGLEPDVTQAFTEIRLEHVSG